MSLTPEQKEKCLKAVELAKFPGACRYVAEDGVTPLCVIAQLGVLEGVSLDAMTIWGRKAIWDVFAFGREGHEVLASYDERFLTKLQKLWDTCDADEADVVKRTMRHLVEQEAVQ
jgi:hypothetical protein